MFLCGKVCKHTFRKKRKGKEKKIALIIRQGSSKAPVCSPSKLREQPLGFITISSTETPSFRGSQTEKQCKLTCIDVLLAGLWDH